MFAVEDGSGSYWLYTIFGLLSILALVLLNGLFVAAEFALVSVRKTRVEELIGQGVTQARSVLTAINNLDDTIAGTQLGITLASIALGYTEKVVLEPLFHDLFAYLPASVGRLVSPGALAIGSAFFLVTFMHVVFGELIPKTMALQVPDRAALWLAKPLLLFARLTRPLIALMNGTGNLLLRLAGFRTATGAGMVHSVEELILLIEDTEEAGILDAEQADLVENIFHLTDKHVSDCMVPRERMASLELNTPPEQVLEAVRSGAHTRMPVYEGDLDNIVGIVNTKDLFYLFSLQGVVILQDALYPPLFLKPDETVSNALRLFKRARRPMALVRDDEGRILGLITLEDVLEEIVGELEDEHDRPTPRLKMRRRPRRFPRREGQEPKRG